MANLISYLIINVFLIKKKKHYLQGKTHIKKSGPCASAVKSLTCNIYGHGPHHFIVTKEDVLELVFFNIRLFKRLFDKFSQFSSFIDISFLVAVPR